jgi:hypothetical protein
MASPRLLSNTSNKRYGWFSRLLPNPCTKDMSSQDYYQTPRTKDMGGSQDYYRTLAQKICLPKIIIKHLA